MSVDLRSQLGTGYTDDDYQRLNQGMTSGQASLPFAHLTIWAFNGSRRAKAAAQQSPTSYYGGWNMDADVTSELATQGNLRVGLDHTGWIRTDKDARGGKSYTVYETRSLHIAPIAKRLSWMDKEGRSRTPEYDDVHRRSHLQVLALVGCTQEVGGKFHIEYVSPAVLSVKGQGQTDALREATLKWSRAIDGLRSQMNARGLPLFSWWMTIGTRGEAEFKTMGKNKDVSEITPLRALMATETLTAEQMGLRFVGSDNFKLAAQLFEESTAWVNAWKSPNDLTKPKLLDPQAAGQGGGCGPGEADDSVPANPGPPAYDEDPSIPF